MNTFFSVLALALISSSAFAGTVYMDANDFASLPDCQGVIRTSTDSNNTRLKLDFSNVVNCSNFDILSANGDDVIYPNTKLEGELRARFGLFTIPSSLIEPGKNTLRVVVRSNSKATSDIIVIRFKTRSPSESNQGGSSRFDMRDSDKRPLKSCGGVVRTKVSYETQMNVSFEGVENCSNFDIVEANGNPVNYKIEKLEGPDGSRFGSFTLPKSVLRFGFNRVTVVLKSNSGKTSETISIDFINFH